MRVFGGSGNGTPLCLDFAGDYMTLFRSPSNDNMESDTTILMFISQKRN